MTGRASSRLAPYLFFATSALASPAFAQGAPVTAPPVAPPPNQPAVRVVVVAAQPVGVDPRAASAVTEELQRTLAASGYDVVPAEQTQQALATLGLSTAASPADLWNVTHATQAQLGVSAVVRAEAGQYVVDLTVADTSGRGPFTGQARSDAPGLQAATAGALRRTLPSGESHPASTPPAAPPTQPPAAPVTPAPSPFMAAPSPSPEIDQPAAQEAPEDFKHLRLAVQTEAAFGYTGDGFYNHLVGGRVDYRFGPRIALGGYVGYANLKGRGGREHNVLPYAQLDYRIRLGRSGTWQMPLRFGAGYLPSNGPFMRLAIGIAVAVSPDVELLLDIAAPALWVTKDLTVVSFDVAGEVGYMP